MEIIALNFKVYLESIGENSMRLARAVVPAAEKAKNTTIILCPCITDLEFVHAAVANRKNILVFAQHADSNDPGTFTGSVPLEALKANGCDGTLLNHSEKKLPFEQLRKTVEKAEGMGLKTIVCANSLEEVRKVTKLKPWCIAVEWPELIATGISISRAKPELVEESVKEVKKISQRTIVLAGAGVSNAEDYKKAIELGADGVLLASRFVQSPDPERWTNEMVKVTK